MSNTEHWRGELYRIGFDEDLAFADMVLKLKEDYDMEGFSIDRDIWCNSDETLVYYYGEFYSIDKEECNPDEDIIEASRDSRDVIQFETKFYNGGASFNECLVQALKDVD
jgi:hypothetical protein